MPGLEDVFVGFSASVTHTGRKRWGTHLLIEVCWDPWLLFATTICGDIFDSLVAQWERRVRVVLGKRDAEPVKQRWLTAESFTALLTWVCGRYLVCNDRPVFLVPITSPVSDSTLSYRKALTVSFLEIMDTSFSLASSVVLVVLAGSVRRDCRKRGGHGTMCGCLTRQPVEAWPNVVNAQFRTCDHEDTFFYFILFCSWNFSFWWMWVLQCSVYRVSETFNESGRGVWLEYASMGVHIWPSTSWGLIGFPDRLVEHYPYHQIECQPPAGNGTNYSKADCVDNVVIVKPKP